MMKVLVTGGTGFIGSHQTVALLEAGHDVVVIDDGSNSRSAEVVARIERIVGRRPGFEAFDVRDTDRLVSVMGAHDFDAVIHFAAYKHVHESVQHPIGYYRNNIDGLASLLEACVESGVFSLVFSSSGSVYGEADHLPIDESATHRPTNPYAMTKSIGERMLRDAAAADPRWSATALRYFNPAGAHPSGLLGEDPTGIVSNLLPVILRVARGLDPVVRVFGDDWPTPDGTAVRDYVHVLDVADAHLAALESRWRRPGFRALNIGTGTGTSVLELVRACRVVTGRPIPIDVVGRRPGDVAALYADSRLARRDLGIAADRGLDEICQDAWHHFEASVEITVG